MVASVDFVMGLVDKTIREKPHTPAIQKAYCIAALIKCQVRKVQTHNSNESF